MVSGEEVEIYVSTSFGISMLMIIYTEKQYTAAKQKDLLPLKCDECGIIFTRSRHQIYINKIYNKRKLDFCDTKCMGNNHIKYTIEPCANCGKSVNRPNAHPKKHKNIFCNCSCAATYNNTHKTTGYKVSKLEKWLQLQLGILYPKIDFLFNNKETINSELDIYIPAMKLAFELNGPFHYEPIFGEDQLKKIQNNDQRKFQACLEHKIELCIIDVSKHGYVKESTCRPFLDIITTIINQKLA